MHLPLRVLFSFRSHYYCTIGLGSYLGLEANGSQILTPYPRRNTREHPESSFSRTPTGLSPSMARRSSRFRVSELRCARSLQHHISAQFPGRIQFALCRVRSPLLTASRLISFPRGTRMLRSPRFPILTDHSRRVGSPIRLSPDQKLLAFTRRISQLGTTFFGARTEPFPRRYN